MPEWWGQASAQREVETWLLVGVVGGRVESMPEWWGQASAQRETGWLTEGVGGRSRVVRNVGAQLGMKSAVEEGVEQSLVSMSLEGLKTVLIASVVSGIRGGVGGAVDIDSGE